MSEQLQYGLGFRNMRNPNYGGLYAGTGSSSRSADPAPTRSFGFQSGSDAIAPGGVAAARSAEAVDAGKSLGEPTSFRAGAGAPNPIQVIRRLNQTFVPGAAPGGFIGGEFADQTQAKQAWNRGMRNEAVAAGDRRGFTTPEATLDTQYGSFRPPGQTLAETPQREIPGHAEAWKEQAGLYKAQRGVVEAGQEKIDKAKVGTDFDQLMHESPYSTFDTGKGKTEFKAKDEAQYRDYLASKNLALAQGDPAVGRKHFEERQQVRQWLQTQPLAPNTNIDAMLDAAASNPEHWQGLVADARKVIKTAQPAPSRSSFFGPTQLQGEAGAIPPAAPAAPPIRPTQPPAGFRGLVESME